MFCIKCISDTSRSVVLRPAWTTLWSDSEICRLHRIVNLVSCENMTLRQDKWPLDKEDCFGLKAFPNICKCCLNFQQCWLCVDHTYQWKKFTVLPWMFFWRPRNLRLQGVWRGMWQLWENAMEVIVKIESKNTWQILGKDKDRQRQEYHRMKNNF